MPSTRGGGRALGEGQEHDDGDADNHAGDDEAAAAAAAEEAEDEELPARLEVDGLPATGVIAVREDLKTELYAVKYVRITVHKLCLEKEDGSEDGILQTVRGGGREGGHQVRGDHCAQAGTIEKQGGSRRLARRGEGGRGGGGG